MDDETNWQRQLLVGLAVLVAVGVLLGGIVALISIKAADMVGLGDGTAATNEDNPTIPVTTTKSGGSGESTAPPTTSPTTEPPSTQPPKNKEITLSASPESVSTYDRINLTGSYPGHAGATLQVQRLESGTWVDFPTTATVNGKTFTTYIETGRTGQNRFRVKAVDGTDTSNVVVVAVS